MSKFAYHSDQNFCIKANLLARFYVFYLFPLQLSKNDNFRSATILAGIIHNNNDVYEKLSVIREGDNIIEDVNERTSML